MPTRANRRSEHRTFQGRTLDVALREDPRNDRYSIAGRLTVSRDLPLQSKRWACPVALDQAKEGACVGFAGAHFFASESRPQEVSGRIARRFYKGAQQNDEWPGEAYEGTSVNGLMAYLKSQGLIGLYEWIRTPEELYHTLSFFGPVIVGCQWPSGCFEPDSNAIIRFEGNFQGGHATCWRGIDVERRLVVIQQSWGRSHGYNGTVYMPFYDVERLFETRPQAVFLEKRSLERYAAGSQSLWQRLQFWK